MPGLLPFRSRSKQCGDCDLLNLWIMNCFSPNILGYQFIWLPQISAKKDPSVWMNMQYRVKSKKIFKKKACIQSHCLHLQWKYKIWVGKFTWVVKAKHCWALSTNFLFSKVCWQQPAMFCLNTSIKLLRHNLNFQWRWRWWDRI